MAGTRLVLATVVSFMLVLPAFGRADGGGLFNRKGKPDPVRIRNLAEVLRADPDEERRRAAVAELAQADPRASPDVVPALVRALQKDRSEGVRAAAAEAIGRFNAVFPVAGLALESAAEADPSAAVRRAAKQALWQYHAGGYRSAKGGDGVAAETPEPPIAKPPGPRLPVTSEPPTAGVPAVAVRPAAPPPAPAALPAVGLPPGPRVSSVSNYVGTKVLPSAVPPHPNLTTEPPRAKATSAPRPAPAVSAEPPINPRWPDPSIVTKPLPLVLDLPSVVTPP